MQPPPTDSFKKELLELAFQEKEVLTAFAFAILRDWHQAEDVVQEALLTVFRKPPLDEETRSKAFAWIRGIIRLKAFEQLRKRRRESPMDEATLMDLVSKHVEPTFDEQASRDLRERTDSLRSCMSKLPAKSRRLLHRFYFENLSHAEIAEEDDRAEASVERQMKYLRHKLRECVKKSVREGKALESLTEATAIENFLLPDLWSGTNRDRTLGGILDLAALALAAGQHRAIALSTAPSAEFVSSFGKSIRRGGSRPSEIKILTEVAPPIFSSAPQSSENEPLRRSITWRRLAAVLVVGSALAAGLAKQRSSRFEAAGIEVISEEGEAMRIRNGATVYLRKGDRIVPGDTLRTGNDGSLSLTGKGVETQFEVGGNAEMTLLPPSWFAAPIQRIGISKGNLIVSADPSGRKGRLEIETGDFISRISGTQFSINRSGATTWLGVGKGRVEMRGGDGSFASVGNGEAVEAEISASGDSVISKFGGADGIGVVQEVWWGYPSNDLSGIGKVPGYPCSPHARFIRPRFESPNGFGENYLSRLHAWLTVPETGTYFFHLACDNDGELHFTPEDGLRIILASIKGDPTVGKLMWPRPREWDKYPSQKSAPVMLEVGKRYLLEAVYVEASNNDHISVGWSREDGQEPKVIEARHLRIR